MRLTCAIVRLPGPNFADGITTSDLGPPDIDLELQQHACYCEALRTCGLDVTVLPADAQYPDGTFVEDAAIVTPRGALITRPGAPSRAGEVSRVRDAIRRDFQRLG
jgi:dimethylargininase